MRQHFEVFLSYLLLAIALRVKAVCITCAFVDSRGKFLFINERSSRRLAVANLPEIIAKSEIFSYFRNPRMVLDL